MFRGSESPKTVGLDAEICRYHVRLDTINLETLGILLTSDLNCTELSKSVSSAYQVFAKKMIGGATDAFIAHWYLLFLLPFGAIVLVGRKGKIPISAPSARSRCRYL